MLISPGTSLSHTLRDCTATAHGYAEKSPFMSRLISGALTRDAVADYTGQLWFIYVALERSVRHHSTGTHLSAVADARLERVVALERDLVALIGEGWREELLPGVGTIAYVDRLTRLGAIGDEIGLVAHHYVRYLGDLAGGQVIARMLRDRYGITQDGLNFYNFAEIGKVKPYRDGYREQIDALGLDEFQASWLVSSANEAFALNGAVFQDLAQRHCLVTDGN